MANLNKVLLIGRLTRDPEVRTIPSGAKVAAFGFAVNNRRKNNQTGEWEEEPVFLDVEAWNRGESGKLADRVESLRKGQQVFLEGHLRLDQWTSKDDNKPRSKIKVVLDNLQYLEPRAEGGEGGGGGGGRPYRGSSAPQRSAPPAHGGGHFEDHPAEHETPEPTDFGGGDDKIPF